MKAALFLSVFVVAFAPALAQEAVHPIIAQEFGKPVTVLAEFVPKSKTYYDQNIVSEPYSLRVISVDGRELKEPVLIEYSLEAEKKERTKLERLGVVQSFEAYESLYQPEMSTPWLPKGEQGMAFALIHLLHVRPLPKKG